MLRFLAVALTLLSATAAQAQTAGIPPEELTNTRRLAGNSINACFDVTSLGRPFDEAVAKAIGDALFLEVNVVEGFGGFPLNGDGFMDELTLAMNNTCDVFMGVSVSANSPFSEAFSLTRPYATIPFVLAVSDPEWQSLGDIPKDRPLGTAMASMGEMQYITWAQQQPEGQSWVRYPYPDPIKMATRVLDGTIAGMILWQPALARLQAERPETEALRIIDSAPIPGAAVSVGALVSSRNGFLRSEMDQAIDALVADGTIDALMAEYGYEGSAGE
ncbi:substrate-binding periplasmic protein [Devosia rhizoryzae]|uniref:Transporter substrate-binding domain-containing protein n=1 Tax=Devosia rhizoryzae TaxID=2774137 RepID=A0ABX7C5W9_9HYPH|nr:transporter substrate-binding domain-containing protein [Devosia rhizoryzae]QQR39652.1 transporter substrate-binding domain-containing protein [Devosia rhizoryzae]